MSGEERETPWRVDFSSSAEKQKAKLSGKLCDVLYALKHDLEQKGPVQASWRNYSQIVNAADFHHCHINNGRPRYVVVWKVVDLKDQIIEIRFVGPHGSVNYKRFKK
jgi:mRNA-degrading endonuclease YafQ of YafQ-DinJ toxin-antitoxin module